MGASNGQTGKPPIGKKEALRQLQRLVKQTTDSYVSQPGLEALITKHWSKLEVLAHTIHNAANTPDKEADQ
jgi:hypothetical protein